MVLGVLRGGAILVPALQLRLQLLQAHVSQADVRPRAPPHRVLRRAEPHGIQTEVKATEPAVAAARVQPLRCPRRERRAAKRPAGVPGGRNKVRSGWGCRQLRALGYRP